MLGCVLQFRRDGTRGFSRVTARRHRFRAHTMRWARFHDQALIRKFVQRRKALPGGEPNASQSSPVIGGIHP
jgi:hypothetical protein